MYIVLYRFAIFEFGSCVLWRIHVLGRFFIRLATLYHIVCMMSIHFCIIMLFFCMVQGLDKKAYCLFEGKYIIRKAITDLSHFQSHHLPDIAWHLV